MSKNKYLATVLATAGILTVLAPIYAAFAEGGVAQLSDNSESSQILTVARDVTKVTGPVKNTFTYVITPDENNPGEVVDFVDKFLLNMDSSPDSELTASDSASIDIGDWKFTKVGDYLFNVRELYSLNEDNYPLDTVNNYDFQVEVRNRLDSDGIPTGELIATFGGLYKNGETNEKSSSLFFSSQAVRTRIEISNTTKGSLADTGKYFKYQINISESDFSGNTFRIIGQDETVVFNGNEVTTTDSISVGSWADIYLKHGQTAIIGVYDDNGNELNQFPIGQTYRIRQVQDAEYDTSVNGTSGLIIHDRDAVEINSGDYAASNVANYLNERNSEGAPFTGVMLNTLPFVGLIIVGGLGLILYKKMDSKK